MTSDERERLENRTIALQILLGAAQEGRLPTRNEINTARATLEWHRLSKELYQGVVVR